jgi:anaerobic magnesium-protoporphyrin IX monomethyl ester cyclase
MSAFSDLMLAGHEDYEPTPAFPLVTGRPTKTTSTTVQDVVTNMRKAAFVRIERAKARGAWVVVNGSDATDHLQAYFAAGADFAILGEGEQTLEELASVLDCSPASRKFESIDGLVYSAGADGPRRNRPRELIRDLDELPFPAWDLVDVDQYRRAWLERHDFFSVNMVTTRAVRTTAIGAPAHLRPALRCPIARRTWPKSSTGEKTGASRPRLVCRRHFRPASGVGGRFAEAVESRGCITPYKIQARVDLISDSVAEALRRLQTVPLARRAGLRRSSTPWKKEPPWIRSAKPRTDSVRVGSVWASFYNSAIPERGSRRSRRLSA